MKSTTKFQACMIVASLTLATALAVPAAQNQVPFKGSFQGKDGVNPPTITTSGAGSGTHIGNFSLSETTSLTSAPPVGSAQLVAANGDTINSTFVVVSFQLNTPSGYATITESHTVTGGTGRFAGAQGSFILERLHLLTPNPDGTHDIFGSFQGSITPPGATN
jgi:hypothetical protein